MAHAETQEDEDEEEEEESHTRIPDVDIPSDKNQIQLRGGRPRSPSFKNPDLLHPLLIRSKCIIKHYYYSRRRRRCRHIIIIILLIFSASILHNHSTEFAIFISGID